MPGERTRIALTPLPLVLLCAAQGIVCVFVAFICMLAGSYCKRRCQLNPQGDKSNVIEVIIDLKRLTITPKSLRGPTFLLHSFHEMSKQENICIVKPLYGSPESQKTLAHSTKTISGTG